MSNNTITEQEGTQGSTESSEVDAVMEKGIAHLPGYKSLQERHQSSPSEMGPTKDTIFDLLRNQRRRFVLQYLEDHTGVVRLGDLADALAQWEEKDEGEADTYIDHRDRKRAYVALYQTHLPKLDEADVIKYNQPRGTIELGPHFPAVQEYLHYSHAYDEILWHRFYLSGGGVCLSALGLMYITAFPFGAVSEIVVYALVFVVFGSISLAQSIVARSTMDGASDPTN